MLLAAGLALILLARGAAKTHYFRPTQRPGAIKDWLALVATAIAAAIAVAWFAFPREINENVCANAVAILFPFTAAALIRGIRQHEYGRALVHAVFAVPAIAALLLTGSHGAWAGLAASALVVALLAVTGERGRRPLAAYALTTGLILVPIAVLVFALLRPDVAGVLGRDAGSNATRPAIWADMLAQLRDVPFTGSGLGATMMTDATYVRLLYVGFIGHAHHLYLQVALEQGLPGLAAFLGLLAVALVLAIRTGELAAVAALTVLLVHGAVDAGVYVARPAPLLFFPMAAAVLLAGAEAETSPGRAFAGWQLIALVPVLGLFVLPSVRAGFQADLGAILQARAELSHYSWPDVPIQDALRRDPSIDLGPAIACYAAALALDPGNATANRRLGQIELARGNYGVATAYLEAAFAAAPTHPATRELLGELRVISGDVRGARALWHGLDLSQGQLVARPYWYEHIGETAYASAIRTAQEQVANAN